MLFQGKLHCCLHQQIKNQIQGDKDNTNQVTGYDKEYFVIGRTFDKGMICGHKYEGSIQY